MSLKLVLLAAAALVVAGCAAPTAPAVHHAPAIHAPAHDVSCPTYDADGRFLGYMVTAGDKCPG